MEVILIFRHLTQGEKTEIESLHHAGAKIVSAPGYYRSSLPGIENIPDTVIKASTSELIEAIKNFGDKFIGDTRVSSLLTFDGIPLWHYQRFRIFFLLKKQFLINKTISYYQATGASVTCYLPSDIMINTSDSQVNLIVRQAIDNKKVRNYKALFNYLLFFKLRVIISLFRRIRIADKKHAIVDRSIRQQCRNIFTLEKKWDNFNLYPLFDLQLQEMLVISEVETPKFNNAKPFTLHSYYFNGEGRAQNTVYGEYILFRGLISLSTFSRLSSLKKEYFEKLDQIRATNLSLSETRIFEAFTGLQKSSHFYFLKYLCYSKFFSKKKLVNIAAIDENSPATRCILDAARKNGASSIGIQHGNIGDSQPAYLYSTFDKSINIMADKTIVWGQYWADFLVNTGNFPSSSIHIAGQMRSDVIPPMLKKASQYRQSIGDFDFIAVFASQPIPDPAMRMQIARDVFSCFKDMESTLLVLKLHPAERHSVSYYSDIADEVGCKNLRIIYDVDLYELLAACDVVITAYSTVGSEAVYFGKPLIIHDSYSEDLLGYIKEGVAMQAIDSSSMRQLVENIRNGQLKLNMRSYTEFISKYAHAIDGQSTARTLDVIAPGVNGALR